MCGGEQSAQKHADSCYDDIGNSKERVAATHDSTSTEQDRLGPVVDVDGEIWRGGLACDADGAGFEMTNNHKYQADMFQSPWCHCRSVAPIC